MEAREINNAKDALEWLQQNPRKKLYDKFGNYFWYVPNENIIEYHHYLDLDENIWDMDRLSISDFLDFGDFEFYI